jgi:hypothetical protein
MKKAEKYDEMQEYIDEASIPENEGGSDHSLSAKDACAYLHDRHWISLSPGLLRQTCEWGHGPTVSTDDNGVPFWTPQALDAWASAQGEASDAGWGPRSIVPVAPFCNPPKFLLVPPKGVEGDYITEQLQEWGCSVVRSKPDGALVEATRPEYEGAVVHVDGSGLGLLVPLIARLINKKVATILVGDVARVPEQLRAHCTDAGKSFRSFDGKEMPLRVRCRMNLDRKIHYSINDPLEGHYDLDKYQVREWMRRSNRFLSLTPDAPLWDVEDAE